MLIGKYMRALAVAAAGALAVLPAARAAEPTASAPLASLGAIVGVVTNAQKRPVAGATVDGGS